MHGSMKEEGKQEAALGGVLGAHKVVASMPAELTPYVGRQSMVGRAAVQARVPQPFSICEHVIVV